MSFLSGLGTVGGAILGSVIPGVGTGLGATIGGGLGTAAGGLFGGGGSGSSGGGGGVLDMEELQKALAAPQFLSDYTQDLFNLDNNFDSGDYLDAMNAGDIDKYQVMNIFDQQGLSPGDKDYFTALTSKIDEERGEELAGIVGQAMFRGTAPSESSIKDAYQYALLTGNTGSPQDAQQAMASYFAQTPEGMKNMAPSSEQLLAGMKYGELVGTDSGVKLFAGTPRTQAMFDRIDAGRDFRSQKTKEIFNT